MCVSELWTFWFWHFFPFLYASFQKLLNSIEDVGRQHFSGDATDFQLDLRLDLDLVFTKHKTYFFKPFLCSFCPMLWLIDLLEHTHCFNPIYRCLTDWNRFSSTICLFGFIYVALRFPLLKSNSTAWCYHHHSWSQEWSCAEFGLCQRLYFGFRWNYSTLASSDDNFSLKIFWHGLSHKWLPSGHSPIYARPLKSLWYCWSLHRFSNFS